MAPEALGRAVSQRSIWFSFKPGTRTEPGGSLCQFSARLHLVSAWPLQWLRTGKAWNKNPLAQVGAPPAPGTPWHPQQRCEPHLQLLQLLHQGPAADEALVQQGEDGRTFQDGLPESSPRTWHRKRHRRFAVFPEVTVTTLDATMLSGS